jgi:hypothetical protein
MEIRVHGADELSKAITHLVDYVQRPNRTLKQASVMMHTSFTWLEAIMALA